MYRKLNLVEVFCQKLVSFFSNNQKIKEDEQEDKVKLRERIEKALISANSFENFIAEWEIKRLQTLLDDEKNKLSDRDRAEVALIKESLKKAQSELVELINILVKKEEYVKNDLDIINAKCGSIGQLFRRSQFACLQAELSKKE
jgi:hypothetical protein